MGWFIAKRALVLVLTLILVSFLAFLVPFMSDVDPARAILRSRVADLAIDSTAAEALRMELGLDQPILAQYLSWLGRLVQGDLGLSFTSRLPVADQIGSALLVSATIAVSALLIALLFAIPIGTLAAMHHGRRIDGIVTFVSQAFVAIPEYWLAPVLVLLFAVHLGWLPSAGWSGIETLILPAFVLSLRPLAYFAQVMRASMIDVLNADYITAARSRGLSVIQALVRHGLRNGILPVLTIFALWLAGLLGGSVVVEVIFAIPGMGRLVYSAVVNNDIPMLQGSLICIVGLAIVINTIADLLYGVLNPAVTVMSRAA
ncbi:MAG: ABC transporter permease [Geminicoccaceae bacterium]